MAHSEHNWFSNNWVPSWLVPSLPLPISSIQRVEYTHAKAPLMAFVWHKLCNEITAVILSDRDQTWRGTLTCTHHTIPHMHTHTHRHTIHGEIGIIKTYLSKLEFQSLILLFSLLALMALLCLFVLHAELETSQLDNGLKEVHRVHLVQPRRETYSSMPFTF